MSLDLLVEEEKMKVEKRDHFAVEGMYEFATKALIAGGYSKKYAETSAYSFLEADKRGIVTHGIAGGTGLEEAVKRIGVLSTVNGQVKPEILKKKFPTLTVIDAHGCPGHYTSFMAIDMVKKIARKYGIGRVYVMNANHFGAAGVWSDRIAEDKDLIGVVNCTTAACVRPMGDDLDGLDYTKGAGKEVRTGTNPEAISIPHRNGIVSFDAAYTRLAASYCLKCLKAGEMMRIPGYTADQDYKPTLDPNKVFIYPLNGGKRKMIGSFFPLGSEGAGYKGDSKLKIIEMDNVLGGGPIKVVKFIDNEPAKLVSHTFYAQRIDFLYSREKALNRVMEMMKDYEGNYFGPRSRWPGDRAHAAMEYAMKNGIPYSKSQVETLERAARHVGLEFDVVSKGRKNYPANLFRK